MDPRNDIIYRNLSLTYNMSDRFEEAIELMRGHQGDVTKVVLEWN